MTRRLDLNRYDPVAGRIRAFYSRHPDGSIRTELVRLEGARAIFRAAVRRGPADRHVTTGWAYERIDAPDAERRRRLASCETAAIGRALANLAFAGERRPSREEMAKVARMRAERRTAA